MIGDFLEKYTYEYLLNLALNEVPSTVDKRKGSVIYDALAPACYRLAAMYGDIRNVYIDTFVSTAGGEYLDKRVIERGLERFPATYAIKKGIMEDSNGQPVDVPVGARFSSISDTNPITYKVIGAISDDDKKAISGAYMLQCEVAGSIGNEYSGILTNITNVPGLAKATLTDLIEPARDAETDEELRERYMLNVNQKPFGGNVAQYREWVSQMNGVGAVQIYPVWDGGGTVKISVLDTNMNVATSEFLETLQAEIDPENSEGERGTGIGIAPIGHKVTVTTPEEFIINVSADVTLEPGISLGQVTTPITNAINEYFSSIKNEWDVANENNMYSSSIYIARLTSAILGVSGVVTANKVKMNGNSVDITLEQTGTKQQVPKLGEVLVDDATKHVLTVLTITSTEGDAIFSTKLTSNIPLSDGNEYVFKLSDDSALPTYDEDLLGNEKRSIGWKPIPDITKDVMVNGMGGKDYIILAERTIDGGKARAAGSTLLVYKHDPNEVQ